MTMPGFARSTQRIAAFLMLLFTLGCKTATPPPETNEGVSTTAPAKNEAIESEQKAPPSQAATGELGAQGGVGQDAEAGAPKVDDGAPLVDAAPNPTEHHANPALVAHERGFVLGWIAADPATGQQHVALQLLARDALSTTPATVSEDLSLDSGHVDGLRLAGDLAVWLNEDGAENGDAVVKVYKLSWPPNPAELNVLPLFTGAELGSPEVLAVDDGHWVVVPDGERVRAAFLDANGKVDEARSRDWQAGNLRPPSHFDDDPNAQPSGPPTHALGMRPSIRRVGDTIEVSWTADWWFSDDLGGYETRVQTIWPELESASRSLERPGDVWTQVVAFDPGGESRLLVQHDPNGGPWKLALQVGDSPLELSSETAGPFVPVLSRSNDELLVGWYSVQEQRYRVAAIGNGQQPTKAELRAVAAAHEAELALAQSGDALAVLYLAEHGGRPLARVVEVERNGLLSDSEPVPVAVQRLEGRFDAGEFDHAQVGEYTLLVWQGDWDWSIRGQWFKGAMPFGEGLHFSKESGSPRCELGGAESLVGADGAPSALVAFHCCDDRSICSEAEVWAYLAKPGESPQRVELGTQKDDRCPRLCATPKGPVVAVRRGAYGSVTVLWGDGPEPEQWSTHSADIPTPNRNNGAHPQGMACDEQVQLVLTSPGDDFATRVDLVSVLTEGPDAGQVQTVDTQQTKGSVWSPENLLQADGRVGMLFPTVIAGRSSTQLRWFETHADGHATPAGATLFKRGSVTSPVVTKGAGGFAIAWNDRASDGVYGALIDKSGSRLRGATRFDDPAIREGRSVSIVVPDGEGWRAFWQEDGALWTARAFE